jgi:hypothetical protein
VPFRYLPSGMRYRNSPMEALPGLDSRPGYGIPFLVRQSYQRHLLQLGATDRLLGELLDRLHEVDLYDRAVIAVVADHGMSFRLGHDHRLLRATNVADIAPVPFFLKLPGQRRGRISDKPLRTIDVLPTLADMVGVRIPWRIDGRSARDATVPAQRRRRIISKKFRHSFLVDRPAYQAERRAALARKLRLFPGSLDRVGPAQGVLGSRLVELSVLPARAERAAILGGAKYSRVDPDSGVVPGHLVGRIQHGRPGGGRVIAVTVNGRIAATGRTFTLAGSDDEQFSLLIPENAFRKGRNRVLLLIAERGTGSGPSKIRGWFRVPPR